ncbi:MBL fold metallo-hydrolase [Geodermatophilus sp. TF02-6]|uniref:MBL fold metallo-hydrolase n=1 Tax=Geodermatophilus sp. TF02-6 TaxID=2250575 RepID=UPI000DE8495E|nr:MBL fold metallo-hydrolase [Geodermatophilus sp. TF02-6]RBY78687.1 MBL fold metallo-hydrolase [Geodermatophilus sp. TF02-6]
MCDTGPSDRSISRRSLLGAAMAGTGVVIAASAACASSADPPGSSTPLRPVLPVRSSQPKDTVLTLLGTSGGPQAEYGRTGTSTVLTVEGHDYVVDAGRSSVTQYLNAGLEFSALAGMFITHLHADHLADYYNYFLLEGGEPNAEKDNLSGPLTVYGPGPAGGLPPQPTPPVATIAPENPTPGIKDLTDRLNEGYAYSYNVFMRDTGIRDVESLQDIHEIAVPDVGAGPANTAPSMEPFTIFEDDRVSVSAILVPHGPVFPAFAFRFDTDKGSVAFSGDTKLSDNVVRIAQGADVLVHEVIDLEFIKLFGHVAPDLLQHLENSHTTTSQVAKVAQSAGVEHLVLTHLVPSNPRLIPDLAWEVQCGIGFSGRVHVGNDLDRITWPFRRR